MASRDDPADCIDTGVPANGDNLDASENRTCSSGEGRLSRSAYTLSSGLPASSGKLQDEVMRKG